MREKGVLNDQPVHPSPAPFRARASAEGGSGARIDESSGSLAAAMCLGGLEWTPAIPSGVSDAQVIAPQPYARGRMVPVRPCVPSRRQAARHTL